MILEKIDGKQPSKRLNESSFNDIHYVEELLFCVFNALDIGQKSLGFHHSGELISVLSSSANVHHILNGGYKCCMSPLLLFKDDNLLLRASWAGRGMTDAVSIERGRVDQVLSFLGAVSADLRVSNVMELKKKTAQGAPKLEETDVAGRAAALSFNGENVGKNAAERCAEIAVKLNCMPPVLVDL